MDRTRPHVAEPGRWHFGGLRGSFSALQPGTLGDHRDLLLVGLRTHMRFDCAPLRVGDPTMVFAVTPGRSGGVHNRDLIHGRKFVRNKMGRAIGNLDRLRLGRARICFVARTNPDRQRRLASGHKLRTDDAFPGLVRGFDIGNGRTYLIGFAAPAFEAATCHVGETIDPNRNIPRAVVVSAAMAGIYFVVLPIVWLGVLGPEPLGKDLAGVLGPTFAPLFGSFGKAAAIWFIMLNMFHGTLQPLAGAARTLAQLSEDGLLPRFLSLRSATDCPWAATVMTATFSIIFLLIGDPIWMIAAANFTYLISVCMPNVAAWLLRRDMPDAARPFRAPKGTIGLGLGAAVIWLAAAILGFQQFGLPTVLFGLMLAYSGAALYGWRMSEDNWKANRPAIISSLHLKLTGAMLLVLFFDGAGYLLAIDNVPREHSSLVAALEDIFVVVALLSISVGLVLPGMITHSATEVSNAAKRLTAGTLREFSSAMAALGRGDLEFLRCYRKCRAGKDPFSGRARGDGAELQ